MQNKQELINQLQILAPDIDVKALINNINVEGDNNIIIQGVNGSTITITQNIQLNENALLSIIKKLTQPPKYLNNITYLRSDTVFGREDDIANIKQKLFQDKQLLLVSAIGGVGKTTAAIYYAKQYEKEYAHILWINGEREVEDQLLTDAELLTNLKLDVQVKMLIEAKDRDTALALVKNKLKSLDKPVLWIVDNAEKEIRKAIRQLQNTFVEHHFLITSRGTEKEIPTYRLDNLLQTAAIDLFYYHCERIEKDDDSLRFVQDLVEKVLRHALTVQLLAKTLQKDLDVSLADFVQNLDKQTVYLKKKQTNVGSLLEDILDKKKDLSNENTGLISFNTKNVIGNNNNIIQSINNSSINIGNTSQNHSGTGDLIGGNKIININTASFDNHVNFDDSQKQEITKGILLYSLPNKMQLNNLHRCIIRIAVDKETILKDLEKLQDEVLIKEDIRISDTMEVIFHTTPYFEVTTLTSAVQIVELFSPTQWDFDIRPNTVGHFPLSFVISVILPKGRKEAVITIKIMVITESVPAAMEFVVSNLEFESSKVNKNLVICKKMIAEGKIKETIEYLLQEYANDFDKSNALLLLLVQYNFNTSNFFKGIISLSDFTLAYNKVVNSLLQMFE